MELDFWFMFPVAIAIATIAMSTGIGGAVFFSPIFLLVLELDPVVAIGTALVTELFGFGSGLIAYLRRRLIDYRLALQVLIFAVPAAVFGAAIGENVPDAILKSIFAVGIVFVGSQIFIAWYGERHEEHRDPGTSAELSPGRRVHEVTDRTGRVFRYNVFNKPVAAVYSTIGGAFVGMISVGIAELMEYQMVAKCRIPPPVAVATAIFIVVVTVAAASVSHVVSFVAAGPDTVEQVLSIAMFTAPGVLVGGQIGPYVQQIAPPSIMKIAISGVFIVVGLIMLASIAFAGA